MKKILFAIIISIFLTSVVEAQISKGSIMLGGGIGISSSKNDYNSSSTTNDQTNYSINPVVGIAVKENLIFGVGLGYGNSESTINSGQTKQENESKTYGGHVFLRKYLPIGKKFYLYGEGALGYSKFEYSNVTTNIFNTVDQSNFAKGWNIALNLSPGLSYAAHRKFHLEASLPGLLNLQYTKSKNNSLSGNIRSEQDQNNFAFSSNASNLSSVNIGFRFFFSK